MPPAHEADSFLSEKTRGILRWYIRGGLTAAEVVGLLSLACLGWYERRWAGQELESSLLSVKASPGRKTNKAL